MSADGSVDLFFGDDKYRFRLAIGQFRELQEKVNARRVAIGATAIGPQTLLGLVRAGDVWPDDLRDILRLGLVGGGMKQAEAHRLLSNNFDDKPPMEHSQIAFLTLLAGLVGVPDDEIPVSSSKKKSNGKSQTSSDTPKSTATEQPSAGTSTK
jgi:hypothetical protein